MSDKSLTDKRNATNAVKGKEQVAQGQYMVSDTLSPALSDCELE